VFKSDWIRDMGEFYGLNIFLAESSATTGGLDSLLEPTGNIKEAQEMAARAFGADHVFFVTNGTSTSNKMVHQALVAPGDIVLLDRNCHKSHHYGLVLAGGQPLYIDAFPMTEYSMYGAVPLASIKKALLDLKAEGRLDKVKMVDLTNCTFDGHIYNTRRVMEECLAIKPDLIFLWDEAWFGFARWSPFLRPRTAMGAAEEIEKWMADPASAEAWDRQQAELGDNPSQDALLATRLIPDPRKVRLRIYQTNSTHKSMSLTSSIDPCRNEDIDLWVELVWYTRSRTLRGSGISRVSISFATDGFLPSSFAWASYASTEAGSAIHLSIASAAPIAVRGRRNGDQRANPNHASSQRKTRSGLMARHSSITRRVL
jgi:arginine decarboxylase